MMSWLTVTEACEHFRVSRNTLLEMIADGRVVAVDRRRPGSKYAKWLIQAHSLTSQADPKYLDFKQRAGL